MSQNKDAPRFPTLALGQQQHGLLCGTDITKLPRKLPTVSEGEPGFLLSRQDVNSSFPPHTYHLNACPCGAAYGGHAKTLPCASLCNFIQPVKGSTPRVTYSF